MSRRGGTVGRAAIGLYANTGDQRIAGAGQPRSEAVNVTAETPQSHLDAASTVARVREFCLQNKMKSRGRTRND
jgi:hypothetical protein